MTNRFVGFSTEAHKSCVAGVGTTIGLCTLLFASASAHQGQAVQANVNNWCRLPKHVSYVVQRFVALPANHMLIRVLQ